MIQRQKAGAGTLKAEAASGIDQQDVQTYHVCGRSFTPESFLDRKTGDRQVIFKQRKNVRMRQEKKEVRTRWLHIRLNETEYQTINRWWQKTTTRERSDYARRVLLKKPVTLNHRNQSADEMLAEMIRLKNELHVLAKAYQQAIQKLHTLDTVPQVKLWLLVNEGLKNSFLQKTEDIKVRMNEIHEKWSQK